MKLKNVVNKIGKVGLALTPVGNLKAIHSVLKPKNNEVTPPVVASNIGVSVAKNDVFNSSVVTLPAFAPVNIQPKPEQGGGISGGAVAGLKPENYTAQSFDSETLQTSGFMEDEEYTSPTQKKVSGWLGKWLPPVETNVNFPDRKPLYIIGGIVLGGLLLFKLIKKR